jgi:ABC-type Zn uptake system ZnuABC Zn-binding protein ZnuA
MKRIGKVMGVVLVGWVLVLLAACGGIPGNSLAPAANSKIIAVATTSIVGDVVRQVGGEHVDVTVLVPTGVDEHAYEPRPQDLVRVADAQIIFLNGAGLEPFAERLIENAGENTMSVAVSDGITLMEGAHHAHDEAEGATGAGEHVEEGEEHAGEHEDEGEAHEGEHEEGHEHGEGDPHVWMDPRNVKVWVANIEQRLTEVDPANAESYRKNAAAYRQELDTLDAWIETAVREVPQERRKLVTDHLVFTYFAERYGFEQVGAVVPGYSTLSSPSAQELAALEDAIRALEAPVIFVGSTVNPALASRVAQDTGAKLVPILTGSLTPSDGPGATYLDYMRHNVTSIVDALK